MCASNNLPTNEFSEMIKHVKTLVTWVKRTGLNTTINKTIKQSCVVVEFCSHNVTVSLLSQACRGYGYPWRSPWMDIEFCHTHGYCGYPFQNQTLKNIAPNWFTRLNFT